MSLRLSASCGTEGTLEDTSRLEERWVGLALVGGIVLVVVGARKG